MLGSLFYHFVPYLRSTIFCKTFLLEKSKVKTISSLYLKVITSWTYFVQTFKVGVKWELRGNILSGVWISAIFGGLSPCLSPIKNLRLSHWKKNLFCVCLICFFCGRCFLVSSFFPVKRLFDWCVFLLVESVKTWNLHVFVHVSWNEIKVSKQVIWRHPSVLLLGKVITYQLLFAQLLL